MILINAEKILENIYIFQEMTFIVSTNIFGCWWWRRWWWPLCMMSGNIIERTIICISTVTVIVVRIVAMITRMWINDFQVIIWASEIERARGKKSIEKTYKRSRFVRIWKWNELRLFIRIILHRIKNISFDCLTLTVVHFPVQILRIRWQYRNLSVR